MKENSDTEYRGTHAWSILLAAVLFLLGEKSLVIAKIGLRIYDGRTSTDSAAFEMALVGLAVGTAAVIVLSVIFRRIVKHDAIAIVTGLVIATLAALLNIAETAFLNPLVGHPHMASRAMYFYIIWFTLLPLPFFVSMVTNDSVEGRPLKLLATIALAFVLSTVVGAMFRRISGLLLFEMFPNQNASSPELAFDRLQYEPDVLIMLGATWIAAAILPRAGVVWRTGYAILSPSFGYAYGVILTDGDIGRCLAYAALSGAAIMPCLLLWPSRDWPDSKRVFAIVLLTVATCALAMSFGFAVALPVTTSEKIVLSLLQGVAGILLTTCALTAFALSSRLMNWDPLSDSDGRSVNCRTKRIS